MKARSQIKPNQAEIQQKIKPNPRRKPKKPSREPKPEAEAASQKPSRNQSRAESLTPDHVHPQPRGPVDQRGEERPHGPHGTPIGGPCRTPEGEEKGAIKP